MAIFTASLCLFYPTLLKTRIDTFSQRERTLKMRKLTQEGDIDKHNKKINTVLNIMRNDKRPIRRLLGSVLLRLPFDIAKVSCIKIKIHDYFIRLHSSSMSVAFWCNPEERTVDYMFITRYLKKDDTYIDVGANIGTTVIPATKAIQGGKAIGFEPHPKIFSYLKENIVLNNLGNNIELHNCALGNKRGQLCFSSKRTDDMNNVLLQGKGIDVPVKLLDDFSENLSNIALVKIDVEGYEKFVIEGGTKTLEKTQCIYFEVSSKHFETFGYSIEDLLITLEKMGFNLFQKKQSKLLAPISCQHKFSVGCTNAFAIRDIENFIERTGWQIYDVSKDTN